MNGVGHKPEWTADFDTRLAQFLTDHARP